MSWSHHREPAPGLWSGTSTKALAVITGIFVTGLSLGVGASWLLNSPANPPRTTAETAPAPAAAAPATTAQATNNSEGVTDPCDGQTWPYVDDKCRAQLAEKSKASRQVRVISTDKSAPSTIVTTPAPAPQSRPAETAARETTGQAPAETPRAEPVTPAPPVQASPPRAPAIQGEQTASTARVAPELSVTANVPPAAAEPKPPKGSTEQPAATVSTTPPPSTTPTSSTANVPPPTSTASTPPDSTASTQPATANAPAPTTANTTPASTAHTTQPESKDSPRNDTKAAENDYNRTKRSKRADRNRDRQNRTARRSAPPDDDRDARDAGGRDGSGSTIRTYQMEGGGRVTVYQRGPTMQVGDRVDFGDSPPRSRRRAASEAADRGSRSGSRDDDVSVQRVESRGFGEFFFGR